MPLKLARQGRFCEFVLPGPENAVFCFGGNSDAEATLGINTYGINTYGINTYGINTLGINCAD